MNRASIDWSLYLVTDRRTARGRTVVDVVRAALRGGAGVVQLRDKDVSAREALALGRALLDVTRPAGVPLVVNDRIDIALALEAEGAHIGQDDLPVAEARLLLGPNRLLGVSAATAAEARDAVRAGADYLGTGDIFGTNSKVDAGDAIGVERLADVVRSVAVPVVAIGGITPQNAAATIRAGAAGVAVISAVFGADDPEAAARALYDRIHTTPDA